MQQIMQQFGITQRYTEHIWERCWQPESISKIEADALKQRRRRFSSPSTVHHLFQEQ